MLEALRLSSVASQDVSVSPCLAQAQAWDPPHLPRHLAPSSTPQLPSPLTEMDVFAKFASAQSFNHDANTAQRLRIHLLCYLGALAAAVRAPPAARTALFARHSFGVRLTFGSPHLEINVNRTERRHKHIRM